MQISWPNPAVVATVYLTFDTVSVSSYDSLLICHIIQCLWQLSIVSHWRLYQLVLLVTFQMMRLHSVCPQLLLISSLILTLSELVQLCPQSY